jgi:hypothetical protein
MNLCKRKLSHAVIQSEITRKNISCDTASGHSRKLILEAGLPDGLFSNQKSQFG